MRKIREFSQRGPRRSRYRFAEMAQNLNQVWEMTAGEDYHGTEAAAQRAAHQWADRHGLKAHTSVPRSGGTVEVVFTRDGASD